MDERLRDSVGIRFSKYIVRKIDSLVKEGSFMNRSDVVRTATTEFISRMERDKFQEAGFP